MTINLILTAIVIIQQALHFIERRDMYDRLMAKNLSEYQKPKIPPSQHIPSAHSKVLARWKNKSQVGE